MPFWLVEMAETEAQLQSYLSEHNVEALLKDIVVKLCVDKPDDELEYIKNHMIQLQKERGNEPSADDDEDIEPEG